MEFPLMKFFADFRTCSIKILLTFSNFSMSLFKVFLFLFSKVNKFIVSSNKEKANSVCYVFFA